MSVPDFIGYDNGIGLANAAVMLGLMQRLIDKGALSSEDVRGVLTAARGSIPQSNASSAKDAVTVIGMMLRFFPEKQP